MESQLEKFGFHINVTACEETGLTEMTQLENGTIQFTSGLAVQILKDLQFMLNFTIQIILADDFFPNVENITNKNNSIAYHLTIGDADIGVGFLYHLIYRSKYAVPMVPFSSQGFYAYFIQPISTGSNRFSKPFKFDLTICFVIVMLVIGFMSTFILKAKLDEGIGQQSNFKKFQESFLWAVATICQQDFPFNVSRMATKIIILIGTYLSVLLYSYYSAAILSYFLADVDVIQKFEQIFDHSFSIYAVSSVNSTLIHLKNQQDSNRIQFPQLDYGESIQRVFKRGHVHLDTEDVFHVNTLRANISSYELCHNTSKLPISGVNIRSGFYARKNFPFKGLFNSKMLKIKEHGLADRYLKGFRIENVFICTKRVKKYEENLGLEELELLFVGYLYGILFSLICLFVENYLRKRRGLKSLRASSSSTLILSFKR